MPKLDAPGDAKPVTFPPDNLIRPAASTFTFTAPPHTHIIVLEMNCRPRACTESISADGKTATARTPPGAGGSTSPSGSGSKPTSTPRCRAPTTPAASPSTANSNRSR
ncbi:hypothetical protein ACU686_13105 [Yinghuangia aomiensis]